MLVPVPFVSLLESCRDKPTKLDKQYRALRVVDSLELGDFEVSTIG